eukprot:1159783-Pelagomonas_calceolata.AAC.15
MVGSRCPCMPPHLREPCSPKHARMHKATRQGYGNRAAGTSPHMAEKYCAGGTHMPAKKTTTKSARKRSTNQGRKRSPYPAQPSPVQIRVATKGRGDSCKPCKAYYSYILPAVGVVTQFFPHQPASGRGCMVQASAEGVRNGTGTNMQVQMRWPCQHKNICGQWSLRDQQLGRAHPTHKHTPHSIGTHRTFMMPFHPKMNCSCLKNVQPTDVQGHALSQRALTWK